MACIQEELHILREWSPLSDLFNKLPIRAQNGLFSQEVKLTCVDILPEFIALGTNIGIIYWYDRKKKDLQRLKCENSNAAITQIKVVSSVEFMVACGNCLGNVSIFQIPKSVPETIPDSLKPKKQQIERYTVSDLHKSAISAIEWSKNGMKLFSGDKNGCVVLTEIDFYMHICKSFEILNEAYEVIQLSYCQQKLLVSTLFRSIICQKQDKWKVWQVGKKDRKILGNFGGLILKDSVKLNDTHLYCSRPGLRIWVADSNGNVQKTLLFKDLLNKECPEVPLINPISKNLRLLKPQREPSFGILLPFNEKLLVTFCNDLVYILDPEQGIILSTISHLRGVLSVATHKDELFILEEERSLIRISYKPEPAFESCQFSPLGQSFLPLTSSIKDFKSKLQTTNIIPAITPLFNNADDAIVNVHTDESLIMNAEEAKESPVKVRSLCLNPEVQKKFDDIGKQDFTDDILYRKKSSKLKKKRDGDLAASTASLSSNSSEEKEVNYIRPTIMNLSAVGVLPDLRSPESIKSDIEYKEKILASMLNLEKVKIDLDQLENAKETHDKPQSTLEDINREFIKYCKHLSEENDQKVVKNGKSQHSNSQLSQPVAGTSNSEAPAVINIPLDWKLANIELRKHKDSDTSMDDWEIV